MGDRMYVPTLDALECTGFAKKDRIALIWPVYDSVEIGYEIRIIDIFARYQYIAGIIIIYEKTSKHRSPQGNPPRPHPGTKK